jgi:hypothetical protein
VLYIAFCIEAIIPAVRKPYNGLDIWPIVGSSIMVLLVFILQYNNRRIVKEAEVDAEQVYRKVLEKPH